MSNYGLLGEKLGHSFSPTIHKQLWDCDYDLMPTPKDQVDDLFRERNFAGINVTIPYKQDACRACEQVDPKALAIGAVNTVVNRDGVLYGYNTDYDGFLYCARRAGVDFSDKKVLILGSGGTSLTARNAVADAGAREIVVISRSLSATTEQAGITRQCSISYDTYKNLPSRHRDAQVIVNTTPVGMYPNNYASPVDLEIFPDLTGVIDAIYNPLTTLLVHEAKKKGIPATNGLSMLVAQAAYAAEYFCGRAFSTDEIEKVISSVQAEMANIVLIGMPGCGKSTVGRKLAKRLNREVIDVDALIVEREGRTIPEIFAENGEDYFRQLETEAAKLAGQRSGVIIACGGGLPTREDNHFPMLQNGRIYYLNRDLDKLATAGRPLSANRSDLPEMFARRHHIYKALCHREFRVREGHPIAIINRIVEDYYENISD